MTWPGLGMRSGPGRAPETANLWVTTRAPPWADLLRPLRGISSRSYILDLQRAISVTADYFPPRRDRNKPALLRPSGHLLPFLHP